MVVLANVLDSEALYQWDPSSGTYWASQSNNCGPTCVTKIAQFYRDQEFGIENTRRIIMGCCVPTTGSQQAAMLSARGVPATAVWIDSLAQLDELLGEDGTRPVVIGVQMLRVPAWIRDHPFLGWHAIVVMDKARLKDGSVGYWINDPNFHPPGSGFREDPDRGKKFYPRNVMQYAFIDNWIRWAVVPNNNKKVFVNEKVVGDPTRMDKRFVPELGKKITLKANKPIRTGTSLRSPVLKRFTNAHTIRLLGRIKQEDMDAVSRPYGPCWVGAIRRSDGKAILGYMMDADVVDGSYRDL